MKYLGRSSLVVKLEAKPNKFTKYWAFYIFLYISVISSHPCTYLSRALIEFFKCEEGRSFEGGVHLGRGALSGNYGILFNFIGIFATYYFYDKKLFIGFFKSSYSTILYLEELVTIARLNLETVYWQSLMLSHGICIDFDNQ